jgi:hypothetical protein
MIAVGVEEIGHMKKMGMAVSHGTRGTFAEVEPHNRLKIRHTIDFIPGLRRMTTIFSSSLLLKALPFACWSLWINTPMRNGHGARPQGSRAS